MDSIKGMFSSPIDSGTSDEIKELIKSVLTTFTGHYVKQYAIGLAKKAIKDAQKPPKIGWKLEKRPPGETKFMEGWVFKRAGPIKKSMQKRYFRVRSDYMIDYYLTEEEAKKGDKGKKKGTIALCGYWVNEDANSGMLQRLFALAKKMGIDTESIPKPPEFPPQTMELYHSRRKSYYIQLEDKQEFNSWLQQMRTCCWMVRGYKNKDKVHVRAFEKAIRETRWEIGRWGYWGGQGTEEEILSDMIADELDYEIMGRIYSKIAGPWQVRSMAQKQVLKIIDKLVLAGVTPAWGAMSKAVEELRPKIEPKLKESIAPLAELQGQIADKIKDGCMSVITPAMDEHVIPHLAKILAVIQSPVADAFNDSYKLFETEVAGKFDPKGDEDSNKPGFRTIDYVPWSWTMWDITRKTDEMYEPLWALNLVFPDIWPWSLIWTAHDNLKQKMDNAVYTYEKRFLKALKDGSDPRSAADSARDSVIADYKHDGDLQRVIYFRYLLKSIVMPPLSKVVNPLVAAILTPIDSIIPGPMKDLVSVREMFDQVLNGIIDDTIDHALRSSS